jgi:hypothetical protein
VTVTPDKPDPAATNVGSSPGVRPIPWIERRLVAWTPSTLDDWMARTEYWTNALATATGFPRHRRVLLEVIEAVAGRFVGRQIEVSEHSNTVALRLVGVAIIEPAAPPRGPRLTTRGTRPLTDLAKDVWSLVPGGREVADALEQVVEQGLAQWTAGADRLREIGRVRLEATDVEVAGGRLDRVRATVDDPRLEPARVPLLVTGPIHLEVHAGHDSIVSYLDVMFPGAVVVPRPDGLFAVRLPSTRWTFIVAPLVRPPNVTARAVRVRLGPLELAVPRRWQRVVTIAIPAPAPLEVVAARRVGDGVVVEYRHPGVRHPLSIERLRDLVRAPADRIDLDRLGG